MATFATNQPTIQDKLLSSVMPPKEVAAPQNAQQSVLQVEYHFPTPVYLIQKPEFLEGVRAAADEFLERRHKDQPLNEIYPVYMTENMYNDPRCTALAQFVAQSAWEILNSQGYAMTNLNTYFTEFWCQEHFKHSLMEQHVHGNGAQIVGFYFIDSPDDSSFVQFHDPKAGKVQTNLPEANMGNVTHASNAVLYKATPGTVMFAPAWLAHSFTRHGAEKPMRFIHFNVNVTPAANLSEAQPTTQAKVI